MRCLVLSVALGAAVLSACGGSTAPKRTVSGSWLGEFAPQVDCQWFGMTLDEGAGVISGSWTQSECDGGKPGQLLASGSNLSGTAVGDSVNIDFGVTGVFIGRLDASGDTLNGDLNSVSFYMTRQ